MHCLCGTADATTCLRAPLRCAGLASLQRCECGRSIARTTRLGHPPHEARPSIRCIPSRSTSDGLAHVTHVDKLISQLPHHRPRRAHAPSPGRLDTGCLLAMWPQDGKPIADGPTRARSQNHSAMRLPLSYNLILAPAHPNSMPGRMPAPGHAPTPNAPTGIHAHTRHMHTCAQARAPPKPTARVQAPCR
jgi:hypothetical protein